jgi:2-oxoglutarate dehydrogenase E2 component (dihydrolipoamide succinyltransferase)
MDRMRKLIAGYMVASVQTSAHVQSFIEVDVTNIVKWRENKNTFEREGEKLTYTPIFMEALPKR